MTTGGGGCGAGVSVNVTTTVRAPLIAGVDISENAPGAAAVTVKTARSVLSATAMVTPLPLSRAIRVSMSGFRSSNVASPSAMAASGTRIVAPASSGPDVWIVDLTPVALSLEHDVLDDRRQRGWGGRRRGRRCRRRRAGRRLGVAGAHEHDREHDAGEHEEDREPREERSAPASGGLGPDRRRRRSRPHRRRRSGAVEPGRDVAGVRRGEPARASSQAQRLRSLRAARRAAPRGASAGRAA